MEIKKIGIFVVIIALLVVPILPFCGDITQYKRIGNTDYYLVESFGNESYADLHYKDTSGYFGESVKYNGYAKEVYWDDVYIVVKCTKRNSTKITNYCIIKQYDSQKKNVPWTVYQYASKEKFEDAKKMFGIREEFMYHTDSNIPWRLHFFD